MVWGRPASSKWEDASDIELINRLVVGDEDSFSAFYKRYGRLIYYCIQQHRTSSTDDIFQDFFLKLQSNQFRALSLWERSRPLPSYLRVVVKNFCIDWERSERRHRHPEGADELAKLAQRPDESPSPELQHERRDLRRGAIKAWLSLSSKRDQRLICDKFHRETPQSVAAEREGLSPGAFRKALFDAQKRYLNIVQQAVPEYFE